jgi:DNA primase
LCLDGDAAGLEAAGRAAGRALPLLEPGKSLRFAILPTGEDPDSLLRRRGPEALLAAVAQAMPLIDFLWAHETRGGPPATPERRAALEARLRARARAIAHPGVRGHYDEAFRERLTAAGLGRVPPGTRRPAPGARGLALRGLPPRPSLELTARHGLARRDDRELLAPLLTEPGLLSGHEDTFAAIPLASADADALRAEILLWHAQARDLDGQGLVNHLRQYGFEDLVDQLLRPVPFLNGEQAKRLAAGAAARWRDLLALHQTTSARTEARKEASGGDAAAIGVLDRELNDSRYGDGGQDSGPDQDEGRARGTA